MGKFCLTLEMSLNSYEINLISTWPSNLIAWSLHDLIPGLFKQQHFK